jgi:isocitrate dehydrogenase (NAD+)
MYRLGLIDGDGIGKEVSEAAALVLEATGVKIDWERGSAGAEVLEKQGALIPEQTLELIKNCQATLKGPITTPIGKGFKSVNVTLRQQFNLFSNVRPVRSYSGLGRYENVDLVIFRENTEDLYAGLEVRISTDEVHGIKVITRQASTAIARAAFEYARANKRKKVSAVHKANIMKQADGLFLEAVQAVAQEFPEIAYEEVIVDNMCMQLVMRPEQFDVIVTENLYGDILSDLSAGLVGGLGLVPGANIGSNAAIFEAVHGSAPDIAGKGIANPIAMILSGAMMMDYLGENAAGERIRASVEQVLKERDLSVLTPDLGGSGTTKTLTNAIIGGVRRG